MYMSEYLYMTVWLSVDVLYEYMNVCLYVNTWEKEDLVKLFPGSMWAGINNLISATRLAIAHLFSFLALSEQRIKKTQRGTDEDEAYK